uniref:Uncharacterized protein n=1 Tax=Oryza nivara TaxID=4536 RepID=A0A0E0J4E7_ORYNI
MHISLSLPVFLRLSPSTTRVVTDQIDHRFQAIVAARVDPLPVPGSPFCLSASLSHEFATSTVMGGVDPMTSSPPVRIPSSLGDGPLAVVTPEVRGNETGGQRIRRQGRLEDGGDEAGGKPALGGTCAKMRLEGTVG